MSNWIQEFDGDAHFFRFSRSAGFSYCSWPSREQQEVLFCSDMEMFEMDEGQIWAAQLQSRPRQRIEQYQPRHMVVIESGDQWIDQVNALVPTLDRLTIRNFRSTLESLTLADEIVLKHGFNWRYSGKDLVLERQRADKV